MLLPTLLAATLISLVACGDDSGSGASTSGGTSVGTSDGAGSTGGTGETSGSGAATTGGVTTSTTPPNPTVPESEATAGLVQTSVQMKLLAAAVAKGEATPDAFQKVFDDWNVYDGTIQAGDPQAWQAFTDALTAMQQAVAANDADAAASAAAQFEAVANRFLGSGS